MNEAALFFLQQDPRWCIAPHSDPADRVPALSDALSGQCMGIQERSFAGLLMNSIAGGGAESGGTSLFPRSESSADQLCFDPAMSWLRGYKELDEGMFSPLGGGQTAFQHLNGACSIAAFLNLTEEPFQNDAGEEQSIEAVYPVAAHAQPGGPVESLSSENNAAPLGALRREELISNQDFLIEGGQKAEIAGFPQGKMASGVLTRGNGGLIPERQGGNGTNPTSFIDAEQNMECSSKASTAPAPDCAPDDSGQFNAGTGEPSPMERIKNVLSGMHEGDAPVVVQEGGRALPDRQSKRADGRSTRGKNIGDRETAKVSNDAPLNEPATKARHVLYEHQPWFAQSSSALRQAYPPAGLAHNKGALSQGLVREKIVTAVVGPGDSDGNHGEALPTQLLSLDLATSPVSQAENGAPASNASRLEVIQQLIKNVGLAIRSGQSEMTIHLKPEHLGHLQVRIATEKNQVTIKIITDVRFVKEAIEHNADQLKTALETHGLEIDGLDVSVAADRDEENRKREANNPHQQSGGRLPGEQHDSMQPELSETITPIRDRWQSSMVSCFA